ncbi:archaetidylserine decarboxylase [Orbaceae bacterium ac157xtp]
MLNQLKAMIQYLLPKQLLTICFGWFASKKLGFITTWMIKGFIKLYHVDMSEAKIYKAESYKTFNDFFARELKDDARPINDEDKSIVMPADGIISQFGKIHDNSILQAKGHIYSLDALVACNPQMINHFTNGSFITTYLSPSNYHRVHSCCDGYLREMIYVPGSLFSVNLATAENISNLFARNERLICLFETDFGPVAQIFVGATIVGSIETIWEGIVTPPRDGVMKRWTYEHGEHAVTKGQDIGCFKLGSTVITLFSPNAVSFIPELKTGWVAQMGEKMAERM